MKENTCTFVFEGEMLNYQIEVDILSAQMIKEGIGQYIFIITLSELKTYKTSAFTAICNDMIIVNEINSMNDDNHRLRCIADYVTFKSCNKIIQWLIEEVQD